MLERIGQQLGNYRLTDTEEPTASRCDFNPGG